MNGEPDLCIGGHWRHASDGGTRDIINPADGSVAAVVDVHCVLADRRMSRRVGDNGRRRVERG
jgi:acyl-CoA reductase-like NAD-dependent aldehyde dehydrogenase